MKNLINWFLASVEDEKGKLSGRRATAFIFVLMAIYTLVEYMEMKAEVAEHIWYGILGMILLLFGVITWENVTNFKNGKKPE
jgi:nitrate/nitrite transporter NarK